MKQALEKLVTMQMEYEKAKGTPKTKRECLEIIIKEIFLQGVSK